MFENEFDSVIDQDTGAPANPIEDAVTDLKALYKTIEGRNVLDELWKLYVITPILYDKPEITHYLIGKRDLVLDLFRDLGRTNPTGDTIDE